MTKGVVWTSQRCHSSVEMPPSGGDGRAVATASTLLPPEESGDLQIRRRSTACCCTIDRVALIRGQITMSRSNTDHASASHLGLVDHG